MSQTLVIEKLTNCLYNAILLLQEEQYTKEDILQEIGLTEVEYDSIMQE